MKRFKHWLVASAALAMSSAAAAVPFKPSADAAALTARIDAFLEAAWTANKVTPAAPANDSEFLRRVYLDLAGRIPTVAEARAYLADKGGDKRHRLVAQLLRRPTYARHMTSVWRHLLIPEADTNSNRPNLEARFERWLRENFAKNTGYDKMILELLTTPVDLSMNPDLYIHGQGPSPGAYYYLKDSKAENLAAASARVFLGLRLECAECHDHPFATWTREQFWGFAAFFDGRGINRGRPDGSARMGLELIGSRQAQIPGTGRIAPAAFPDGVQPQWKPDSGPRQVLAEWVTGKNNPYFARATANRVWAQMFGTGLVEPVDEMAGGQDTKIHDRDLLDELAKAFVTHRYDLKLLVEAIVNSKAYQLTSRGVGTAPLFSRQPLRGLTGEQLYESLVVATGLPDAQGDDRNGPFRDRRSASAEFSAKFGQHVGKATERETSIIQALNMMNGSLVSSATHSTRSHLLGAVLESPFLDQKSRIETLYLATLTRLPTEKELHKAQSFIGRGESGEDPKKARDDALTDIFWALINSAEFAFNH